MKLSNQFKIIHVTFYIAVILSCFTYTSAKSAPLKLSNVSNFVSNNYGSDKTIQSNSAKGMKPIANGDLGSGRTGNGKAESKSLDSTISKVDQANAQN